MHKLIITAHPHAAGFTHHIAQTFVQVSQEQGHGVRVLDLYDPKYRQDYLQVDAHSKPLPDHKTPLMHDHIAWADELVFIYPLRRYDTPAIMKNRFDVNFTSGFAFRYKKGHLLPHRLLKGKTARVFITAGSPKRTFYLPTGRGVLCNMIIGRLFYVGIRTKSFTIFGDMIKYRNEKYRQKFLRKVAKIAAR